MPGSLKKVIIIGPAFPLRGGIADFNESLCRSMCDAGAGAQIISFSLQYPSLLFPGKTQFSNCAAPLNIKISALINSINPFNWVKVAQHILKEKPELVIIRFWLPFMGPCLGTIARLIKRNSSIKIIAITDNVIPHEKRPGDTLFTRYFINGCDAFIAMSQTVLNDLKIFTDNKNLLFLPHPIYDIFGNKISKADALNKLKLNKNDRHILFFGFIRKYKGLDLLLQAMADKRVKDLNIKLIVAGEFYEDSAPYKQFIKSNKLTTNVILKSEFIAKDEVASYFCAADIIVQPYITATQSGVTQIAYHFERPMLVTNVGGLPEMVPHNKVGYVTETNAQAIADAIVDFYTSQKEEVFTNNVREEKKRFSWGAFVQGLAQLYEELN